jgi:cell division protease FtsH
MTRQSMYLFYLLPFLLMNSAHTWFNVEPDTVKLSNPTVDCVNYLNTQLNVFEPPTTGIDWTYGMLESNIENINCAVVYSYSDKIVFIDDDFEKDVSLQNVHHMNTVPSLSQNVIDVLKENKKVFFVESYYPQPNWFFSWGYYLLGKFLIYLWYFLLIRTFLRIIYLIYNIRMLTGFDEPRVYKKSDTTTKNDNDNEKNSNKKTFEDVAGCDEAKEELEEVVEFLKNPEEFEKAGAKIPAGVLLEGPPGTGKTLLARATANEANVNFVHANGSEFIEMYVGVGASRVRKLFETAEENKPCIVFIDEIDAIGASRSNSHGRNDERDQTLNQLLTMMDGFQTKDGIMVLAATNRADILDPALTRNGRFDRKVTVGLPDKKGREAILSVHLEDKSVENNCNLESIYELTTGFSGAELANLANEAAILSVRYKLPHITEKCLVDAFEKNTIGLPKKSDNRPKENIRMVAYHEAGHTITALFFKHIFDVRRVTINANNTGAGGYTLFTPKEEYVQFPTKRYMLANIIISLGGRAAEMTLYKEKNGLQYGYNDNIVFQEQSDLDVTTGASNDLKQANNLARAFITKYGLGQDIGIYENDDYYNNKLSDDTKKRIDTEIEKIISNALNIALNIIDVNRKSLDRLSEMLIDFTTVNGEQLKEKLEIKYDIVDNHNIYP